MPSGAGDGGAGVSGFFSPASLASVLGGAALGGQVLVPWDGGQAFGVAIDTRELRPGQVFVALAGERTDGHRFLREAHRVGASAAVVERGVDLDAPAGLGLVAVGSTRSALAALAAAYRRTLTGTKVIAVTGSNGKTTTVRLIDAVLGSALRGSASRKSHNNELGLPLTLLNTKSSDEYVVCELGMSAPGEIRRLGEIAAPDIGVITGVGRAHLERLGSLEAVAQEKASLLRTLGGEGVGVVAGDSPVLARALPSDVRLLRFGFGESSDLRVRDVQTGAGGLRFTLSGGGEWSTPLVGAHNALNAAASIAVGRLMGLEDPAIASGLAVARGAEMRLERRTIAGVAVINDAYNANPESVLAALAAFAGLSAGAHRRVLVLGEMRELGSASGALHREIGEATADLVRTGLGPDAVVLVGPDTAPAAEPLLEVLGPEGVHIETGVGDGRRIAERLRPGDAVLLKGSRAVGLERVVAALEALTPASR